VDARDDRPATTHEAPAEPGRRGRLAPVIAGFLLDAVDFMTMGPIGLAGGFVLGGVAAWWAAREMGLRGRGVWVAALAGAVYAATPATELIPLGTLIGLGVQVGRR
jgi:hypothetical protein